VKADKRSRRDRLKDAMIEDIDKEIAKTKDLNSRHINDIQAGQQVLACLLRQKMSISSICKTQDEEYRKKDD